MFRIINLMLGFTIGFILLSSCNVSRNITGTAKETDFTYNYCEPTIPYQQSADPVNSTNQVSLAGTNISRHDELICKMLGISSAVDSLWLINHKKLSLNRDVSVLLKQRITGMLFIAQSQLQAVAAELDCEGERSNLAANYLDAINNRRKTDLTVASVITGALTTVGTSAYQKNLFKQL